MKEKTNKQQLTEFTEFCPHSCLIGAICHRPAAAEKLRFVLFCKVCHIRIHKCCSATGKRETSSWYFYFMHAGAKACNRKDSLHFKKEEEAEVTK